MNPSLDFAIGTHRLLATLIPRLESEGMVLYTHGYRRVQQLLQKLPQDLPESDLKVAFCTVFATNPVQQKRFYTIFDDIVKALPDLATEDENLLRNNQPSTIEPINDLKEPHTALPPSPLDNKPKELPPSPGSSKKRPLVVDLEQCTAPPFTWNILLGKEVLKPSIHMDEGFAPVLFRMRRREQTDMRRLDLPATIRATIEGAGAPTLRYKNLTRPPEYPAEIADNWKPAQDRFLYFQIHSADATGDPSQDKRPSRQSPQRRPAIDPRARPGAVTRKSRQPTQFSRVYKVRRLRSTPIALDGERCQQRLAANLVLKMFRRRPV